MDRLMRWPLRIFSGLLLLSCDNKIIGGFGREPLNPGEVVAPSFLTSVIPSSATSNITTPIFQISGLTSGDIVKLYTDVSCSLEVASGIATGSSLDIATSALSAGTHTLYAKLTRGPISSSCSHALISYTVQTSYTCSMYSSISLGSITNSATSSMEGQSVFVESDYGYMGTTGATNTGIQIVDLSSPGSPSNVSYITTQTGFGQIDPTSNDVLDLIVENNVLFAVTYAGGFLVVDISDKFSPVFKSKLNLSGETWAVSKRDNYVYIGSLASGLIVVDVTDLSNPIIASTSASMPLRHMQIVGDRIYGSTDSKIQVIDISDPTTPALLGQIDVGALGAYETYFTNGYLYAIEKTSRNLSTYDVTNPTAITLLDRLSVGINDPRSIDGIEDKIFIGTGSGTAGEIRTYSIETPSAPSLLGAASLTHRAYEIAYLKNGKVVSANKDGKLEVTQVCSP